MADSGDIEDTLRSGGSRALPSSDFQFSIALSPSFNHSAPQLCPADELFYKGHILPLHLSLLLSSSDATSATASRDSNGSSSSRPSSVAEEDYSATKRRHFSSFATRFASFFLNSGNKKDLTFATKHNCSPFSAKGMIKKYAEKVKPLYKKLSSLHRKQSKEHKKQSTGGRTEIFSSSRAHWHSFTGNLRSPYRMSRTASCPSSRRSSPSHSGLLCSDMLSVPTSSSSSMEEVHSAIQAAIAHCKSTMAK